MPICASLTQAMRPSSRRACPGNCTNTVTSEFMGNDSLEDELLN